MINLSRLNLGKRAGILLLSGILSSYGAVNAAQHVSLNYSHGVYTLEVEKTTIKDVFNYIEKNSSYVLSMTSP